MNAYSDADQNEKTRFVEFVRQLTLKKSKRQSARWDGAKQNWLQNILAEHALQPFHAIVTPQAAGDCREVTTPDVDLNGNIWSVARTKRIERTGEAPAAALAPMLNSARTVTIFDPVFRPVQRFDAPIKSLLDACAHRGLMTEVRILIRERDDDRPWKMFEKDCERLRSLVPEGVILELVYIPEASAGTRLHNRFVLTESCGVLLGNSIDEGRPGEMNDVALMDDTHFLDVLAEANRLFSLELRQRKQLGAPTPQVR
jgi:hypothetical protein